MIIRKAIPDIITSLNLLCGVLGVMFTFNGRPDIAFCMMLAAAVFDFLDGLAARALDAYSDIGKELDSLCDVVSFGVLPALMLYRTMVDLTGAGVFCCLPLILAVFSALRLAKFNIDERQHGSFLGLPTPASAMICGALCCYVFMEPASAPARSNQTNQPLRYYAKADFLIFQNKDDEADKMLDSVLIVSPYGKLADDVYYQKAKLAIKRKDYLGAEQLLGKIVSNYSYDLLADDAIYLMAQLYDYYLKDTAKAMELYQKMLKEHPDSLYTNDSRKRYRELRGDTF